MLITGYWGLPKKIIAPRMNNLDSTGLRRQVGAILERYQASTIILTDLG